MYKEILEIPNVYYVEEPQLDLTGYLLRASINLFYDFI